MLLVYQALCIEIRTFEEGRDIPGGDPSLLHELSQCNLQEEDWDAPDEHNQHVGDKENPCNAHMHQGHVHNHHMSSNRKKHCLMQGTFY